MRRQYVIMLLLLIPGIWLSLAMSSCGNGNSSDAGQAKLTDEQTELVRYYLKMKAVGTNGLVDRFLSMRDSVTNAQIDTYFTWRQLAIDSAKVYHWATSWPDIAGYPVVQDSIQGRWRRLVFRQCGLKDDKDREQCLFHVVLFGKNGDQWKVSNAYRIGALRYRADGTEQSVDSLSFHKLFQLPPSFVDLKPREAEPPTREMNKTQIDSETGKPIYRPQEDSS